MWQWLPCKVVRFPARKHRTDLQTRQDSVISPLSLAQIISDLDMKKNVCIVHEVQALMDFLNILILLHFEIRAMRGKDS